MLRPIDPFERVTDWSQHDSASLVNILNGSYPSLQGKAPVVVACEKINGYVMHNIAFWTKDHIPTLEVLVEKMKKQVSKTECSEAELELISLTNLIDKLKESNQLKRSFELAEESKAEESKIENSKSQKQPKFKQSEAQVVGLGGLSDLCDEVEEFETQGNLLKAAKIVRNKINEMFAQIYNPNQLPINGKNASSLLKLNPNLEFIAWERSTQPGIFAVLLPGEKGINLYSPSMFLKTAKQLLNRNKPL